MVKVVKVGENKYGQFNSYVVAMTLMSIKSILDDKNHLQGDHHLVLSFSHLNNVTDNWYAYNAKRRLEVWQAQMW